LSTSVFLLTPPFTQLNTPYPATAYLKGFLNTKNIASFQADLGIEVILKLYSANGLRQLFDQIASQEQAYSPNARRILSLRKHYIHTVEGVVSFLQGKNPTLAQLICQEGYLPRASRFQQLADLNWAFGSMGIQDKAKHLATLYLEDLADLITECADEHFGLSRYAERLGRSAYHFDELYGHLQRETTYIDQLLLDLLDAKMAILAPQLVAISVPFPGNLYTAFRCGQWIKRHYPQSKVAMGGGFANTELRSLSDARVFEFFDFIILDDGEAPLENLLEHLQGQRPLELLKRSFTLVNNQVEYLNHSLNRDYKQQEVGTPDYSDLLLDQYISAIEVVNPMHRMWSDGRWNKLTMAHGCYWGKCTFCDISLDYIKVYEPVAANLLCDRMEELIAQTGERGFHFVDEAAPPALMRALALEIIRRKLIVSWWTNIRFEKSFTRDLCLLLKASGCIAVSGGLEVASDRLLALIQKGVTVAQVARVTRNFSEAGILVHAYLMYGFPSQTTQETIDSLEMVRQLFAAGVLQSGFWHQFALTAHSPVGLDPKAYGIRVEPGCSGPFANNDILFHDPVGTDNDSFSYGLKKSLLNYMHGIGFDHPLQNWFDFKILRTKVPADFIVNALKEEEVSSAKPNAKVVWLGNPPELEISTKTKRGETWENALLTFYDPKETLSIKVEVPQGRWVLDILDKIAVDNPEVWTFQQVQAHYEAAGLEDFELFWYNKPFNKLQKLGLLVL
jgi:hypothetical protein